MSDLFAAIWGVLATTWYAICRPLRPITEPLARPVQRWDDRRLARQLIKDAEWLAEISPDAARKLRLRAVELLAGTDA